MIKFLRQMRFSNLYSTRTSCHLNYPMARKLAVFDFDHTILDDNSDTAVVALLDKSKIPKFVQNLYHKDGWTAFMQEIFKLLNTHKISADVIRHRVKHLPPVQGMVSLLKELKRKDYDTIIISDSNSIFIEDWLEANELQQCVKQVFTNPAQVVDGELRISMYHFQDTCKLSTKNLCKGQILDEYIAQQKGTSVEYEKVIYIGDGTNDFCPILRLKETDLACVRNKYKLVDMVTKTKNGKSLDESGKTYKLHSEVLIWDTGSDILKKINE